VSSPLLGTILYDSRTSRFPTESLRALSGDVFIAFDTDYSVTQQECC